MDLGQLATAVLRSGIDNAARGAHQRVTLSVHVLLPVVEAQARAGQMPEQLARTLSAAAAVADHAALVLPPGNGPARLELGMRQFAVPAALRDALLAALTKPSPAAAGEPGLHAPPAGGVATAATAAAAPPAAPPAAALLLSAAAAARALLAQAAHAAPLVEAEAGAPLRNAAREVTARRMGAQAFTQPLLAFDGAPRAEPTAQRLASSLARSGLFFEAHLAEWQRGERSLDAVRAEFREVAGHQLSEARHAGRTAAQIDALRTGVMTLQGPAWPGQEVLIEIGRVRQGPGATPSAQDAEPEEGGAGAAGDAAAAYFATLRFELPTLGTLVARVRLTGDVVAVQFQATDRAPLHDALPDFAAALHARGLHSGTLTVLATAPEEKP